MAKYLRTTAISASLEELIRDANEKLYIISPYLKLSDQIKELLNDKEREKTDVRIIFGKQELNPSEMSFLQGLKYVRLYFSKNLHAKCYLNEKKMIITSMNLYEFSQQNNREMGILIDREDKTDCDIYDEAWKDIESILHNADDFSYVKAPKNIDAKTINQNRNSNLNEKKSNEANGFCIRTGIKIPFNIEKPMCYEAYKSWSKYGDIEYPEKYCHYSGEASNGETSVSKPILKRIGIKLKKFDPMYKLS